MFSSLILQQESAGCFYLLLKVNMKLKIARVISYIDFKLRTVYIVREKLKVLQSELLSNVITCPYLVSGLGESWTQHI